MSTIQILPLVWLPAFECFWVDFSWFACVLKAWQWFTTLSLEQKCIYTRRFTPRNVPHHCEAEALNGRNNHIQIKLTTTSLLLVSPGCKVPIYLVRTAVFELCSMQQIWNDEYERKNLRAFAKATRRPIWTWNAVASSVGGDWFADWWQIKASEQSDLRRFHIHTVVFPEYVLCLISGTEASDCLKASVGTEIPRRPKDGRSEPFDTQQRSSPWTLLHKRNSGNV